MISTQQSFNPPATDSGGGGTFDDWLDRIVRGVGAITKNGPSISTPTYSGYPAAIPSAYPVEEPDYTILIIIALVVLLIAMDK